MPATNPWGKYKPEPVEEPTATVPLTIRECCHILNVVPIGHTWDEYSTGFSIGKKLISCINRLELIGDEGMVGKMMAGPVGRKP